MRKHRQNGQALLLVVTAVGLLLMGGLGFAIDTSQLFGHRQMAQAAADSAATAAIISIYAKTNVGTNAFGSSSFNCTNGTDVRTPCAYARLNGFSADGAVAGESVAVDFPGTVAGVTLSPSFSPAAVHVAVTRPVTTTFLRFFRTAAAQNVTAFATAAIMQNVAPIPIIVLHPTLSGSFALSGTSAITICGGPQQSIQVNSNSSTALSVGGTATVDLSKGGPLDTAGNCATGTGTDFGSFGGPSTNPPSWLTPLGSTTHFYQPNLPIYDPLAGVSPPSLPAAAPAFRATGADTFAGTGDCPAWALQGSVPKVGDCTYYFPGAYPNGIGVKGTTAIFNPGIYYMQGSGSGSFNGIGFGTGANGDMIMCSTSCTAAPSCCTTNNGMLVYLDTNAGVFSIPANSTSSLVGTDITSSYQGILFFGARDQPAHTGSGSHIFGGGGNLTLKGTIYVTNTTMTAATYQNVRLRGKTGSGTLVQGEIIVSALDLGGAGAITMDLNPNAVFTVNQIALVN